MLFKVPYEDKAVLCFRIFVCLSNLFLAGHDSFQSLQIRSGRLDSTRLKFMLSHFHFSPSFEFIRFLLVQLYLSGNCNGRA